MYNIKFDGQNSEDFNIFIKSRKRNLKTGFIQDSKKIKFRNGSIKYNDSYSNFTIVFKGTLLEEDYYARRVKIREIAQWLNKSEWKELVLDDEADIFYKAICVKGIDTDIMEATDEFQIEFECKPFKYSALDRDILLGDNIFLGSDVALGSSHTYELTGDADVTFPLNSTVPIDEYNILITSEFGATTMQIGNMILSNMTDGQYVISVSNRVVYKLDGDNIINEMQSFNKVWDELPWEDTSVTIPITFTGLSGKMEINFNFQNTYI